MKRLTLVLFFTVLAVTLALAGFYFYASGSLKSTVNQISGDKITVSSQNPNIEVKITDQKKLESYLTKYDILGNGKELALPNEAVARGDVKQIQVNIVSADTGYGQTYSADSSRIAFSYHPEFSGGLLKLNLYINSDWLKSFSEEEKRSASLEVTIESLYLSVHKVTVANVSDIRATRSKIYNEIITEKPGVLEFLVK